jgi:hypothetical protein
MKSKKQTEKLIKKYMEWWRDKLGLDHYRIVVTYVLAWEGGLTCDALCDTKWQYLDAGIQFNVNKMKELSDRDIEETVVHELMHIFLNQMREEGVKNEERVATELQKAFMWVRDEK